MSQKLMCLLVLGIFVFGMAGVIGAESNVPLPSLTSKLKGDVSFDQLEPLPQSAEAPRVQRHFMDLNSDSSGRVVVPGKFGKAGKLGRYAK
ncbi:MAG: hypothetical protein ABGY11_08965, partial [Candidatus Thioglobus sp.]